MTDGSETTGGFSGQEWLRHFMEARGRMDAEVTWMTFVIGQAGAVMALGDQADAEKMLEALKSNRDDLKVATEKLNSVVADMVANAERTTAAKSEAEQ